jgi:hypothetical protein
LPRPSRYSQREDASARTGAGDEDSGGDAPKVAARAAADPPAVPKSGRVRHQERNKLDDGEENGQSSRNDPTREAELEVSRTVARRLGWTPQEEWKRDPAKWVDADVFLERTPQEVESLRGRLTRAERLAEQADRHSKEAVRAQAEDEVRAAVTAGDVEKAVEATRRAASVSTGPDPRTVNWVGRNPWFDKDPDAKALAVAVVKRAFEEGRSHDEQLEEAESAVRRRFPEHFGGRSNSDPGGDRDDPGSTDDRSERRLSEVRRSPTVQGGSRTLDRGRRNAEREKGWQDVPKVVQEQQGIFVKNFMRKGMTQDEARSHLAKGYFDSLGNQVRGDD